MQSGLRSYLLHSLLLEFSQNCSYLQQPRSLSFKKMSIYACKSFATWEYVCGQKSGELMCMYSGVRESDLDFVTQ